jgi:hypothetical protein
MSCTHRKKNEKNRTSTIGLSKKQRVSKAYPTIKSFFLQSYGKSTQILHHFEVRIEYSREGAVQEISNKES